MYNSHQTNNPPQLTNVISIPFNKKRLCFEMVLIATIWLCAFLFVLLFLPKILLIWQAFIPARMASATIWIIAILIALFLILSIIYYIKKLFSKKPAIVISDEGIIDNTNMSGNLGLIPWTNVINIITIFFGDLRLTIHNYTYYMNRERNGIKKLFLKANLLAPSSLIILTKYANIQCNDLKQLIEERHARAVWQQQQQSQPPTTHQQ